MSSFPRKILLVAVLLLCVGGVYYFWHQSKQAAPVATQTPRGVLVVTAKAERRTVPHLLHAVGTAAPLHDVVVRPQIEGILTGVRFREGQYVEKDQLLATIDDRVLQATLRSAEADRASNQAQLRSAQTDLERYRNLAARNAISRQTLDRQDALVEQFKAEVSRNEASIEDAKTRLSYTKITSPVSGRIGIRRVDEGNFVRPGDGIVSVTQMHPISVLFSVPQTALPQLRGVKSLPDGAIVEAVNRKTGSVIATGPVRAIDNTIRAGSGTVQVRALFDNETEALWPGQFVSLRVPVGYSRNAVVVPAVAVRLGMEGTFVYRVAPDGKSVEQVAVKTGYRDDDAQQIVIEEGIQEGDTVITDGFVRLRDGAAIEIANAESKIHGDQSGESAAAAIDDDATANGDLQP